jgi:threonine 3-dehydrogenase
LAKRFGATRAVDVRTDNLRAVMQALGMTEGFDVGLEMSGAPSAFNQMLATMNHGGKIALLGLPPKDMSTDWNQIIFKGLHLKGIYGREMFETWYKMASLVQAGLDIAGVITHTFSVDDYQTAFATLHSGQSGKVVLEW